MSKTEIDKQFRFAAIFCVVVAGVIAALIVGIVYVVKHLHWG